MKRRAFFTSIARAVAIVAIAPQLAFRTPKIVHAPLPPVFALTVSQFEDHLGGLLDKLILEVRLNLAKKAFGE